MNHKGHSFKVLQPNKLKKQPLTLIKCIREGSQLGHQQSDEDIHHIYTCKVGWRGLKLGG